MRRLFLATVLCLAAAACGDDLEAAEPNPSIAAPTTTTQTTTIPPTTPPPTTAAPPTTTTAPPATTVVPTPSDCRLTAEGDTLAAAIGLTAAELLDRLGPAWSSRRDDRYLVDVEGYRFACAGEDRFYAGWSSGLGEEIRFVLSEHPGFVDTAGVGPGTLVADAIAAHGGSATVGMTIENEQREFITFADGGTPGWMYQVRGPDLSRAGISPESDDSYVETSDFVEGAVVERIWIVPPVQDRGP